MKQQYIIKSGSGYFLNFGRDKTPYLTTDYVEASRFYIDSAEKILKEMAKKGFVAEIICLRFGKHK